LSLFKFTLYEVGVAHENTAILFFFLFFGEGEVGAREGFTDN